MYSIDETQSVRVDNVRFVDLKVKGEKIVCRSTYLYYKIGDVKVVDATNHDEQRNLPIPFKGDDLTPKMRSQSMNLSLARMMLRNKKYELLTLCVIYQGYKAVGEEKSREAQDVAGDIQRYIELIHDKYGKEALDQASVLAYAGLSQ